MVSGLKAAVGSMSSIGLMVEAAVEYSICEIE
jgi:hypothetical protein